MKKFLAMAMALAMTLSLASCGKKENPAPQSSGSNGANAPATVESGKLIVSTNAEFPPYEFMADDGSYEGIDIEVAGLIADKLGLELQVDNMGFTQCLEAVQSGRSDMALAGVTVTKKRLVNMDFSNSYATGVQVVIVPEDSPIETPDDLANADLIGVQEGTTGYIYCSAPVEEDGFGEDHVNAYEDGAVAIQALLAGKIDCVVIDNEPAKAYVAANPGLKILETPFAVEDYAIALKKGNTEMADSVNAILAELIADGSVQEVIDKYIKAD